MERFHGTDDVAGSSVTEVGRAKHRDACGRRSGNWRPSNWSMASGWGSIERMVVRSNRGWIGGIFGTLFGIGGGVVGWLTQHGKGRLFVHLFWGLGLCVGIVSLVAGVLAIACQQPYGVWYPLALIGVLATTLSIAGSFNRIASICATGTTTNERS